MKYCSACQQSKEQAMFSRRVKSKDGLEAWCKECSSKHFKAYYQSNKSAQLDRVRNRRIALGLQSKYYDADISFFEKLISKIDTNGECWEWKFKNKMSGRYPILGVAGSKPRLVSHIIWEMSNDERLGNRIILHRCDNPSCVKPSHLIAGTHADNVADKVKKGRQAKGSMSGRTKLTEVQVLAIRNSEGSHMSVAKNYGVDNTTISLIRRGKIWKHLL